MRIVLLLLPVILFIACTGPVKKDQAHENIGETKAIPFIKNMRQITFDGTRAGEGYFSYDGRYFIFQSEREPENPFYQIYLTDNHTGKTSRVSPGYGKTTCAWMHPSNKKVMFSSTHHDPELKKKVEQELLERKSPKSKYNWSFDDAFDIYEADTSGKNLKNLTRTKGYDAEGSYSPDGKWIAFASNRTAYNTSLNDEESKILARDPSYFMEIYIMKADGSEIKRLTNSPGYDGGPFFSPDGKRITFRRFSPDGHSAEVYTMNADGSDQRQITQLKSMSWAPFYHPSGDYLIFASNKEGFSNFELFIVDVSGVKNPVRASFLPGFDGLPVFTPDGRKLVWTHTNDQGQAQLHQADWDDQLARQSLGLQPTTPQKGDLKGWVNYLASENFNGRMTGGDKEAEYVSSLVHAFKEMGLKTEIQTYDFISGVELGPSNYLSLQIKGAKVNSALSGNWIPLSFSKNGKFIQAPMVFSGYGIMAPQDGVQPAYDSYKDIDVKDKWVLVFSGLPDAITNERRFHLHLYSRIQHKAMIARQNGAIGLVVIDDTKTPDTKLKLSFEGRAEDAGLPVIRISNAQADKLFESVGTSRKEWTEKLAKGDVASLNMPQVSLEAEVDLVFRKNKARNVLARLASSSADKKWVVLVGAHLDHLGRGESGSSLDKEKNMVHYGADDNASGVAAVIKTAQDLSEKSKAGDIKLKQDVMFALWTGEELGLLGSSFFINDFKKKKSDNISAYLNLDMVGRMRESLIVQGVGSGKEWRSLIERVNAKYPMNMKMQDDPYLPTDAMAFYLKEIPSISFFTGSHPEYHTHLDKPELINFEGLQNISGWVTNLTATLASTPTPIVKYTKVEGSKRKDEGRGFRLYLGTIPDYAKEGQMGVQISGTSKNSPAEKAGLKSGDVIIELGGLKIQNIHDYVYCLQALKANEKIKMKVLRAGKERELDIVPELKSHQ